MSPFSPLLSAPVPTDNSTKGTVVDNMLFMVPAVWGRLGKTVYQLIAALHAATPEPKQRDAAAAPAAAAWSSDITPLAEVLDVALPVMCGSRNERSRTGDVPARLTAAALLRAVLENKDHVQSDGISHSWFVSVRIWDARA